MRYTLTDIEQNPELLTSKLKLRNGEILVFRPLESNDITELTEFLQNLSQETRHLYVLDSFDKSTAQEMCKAINKYDKLRFVLVDSDEKIVGLFEFSFDIPDGDKVRFLKSNIQLDSEFDCRVGPCLADDYQGRGVATQIFSKLVEVAKKFGQKRIILWGGVFKENERALGFYERNGFAVCGKFVSKEGKESLDMILDIIN